MATYQFAKIRRFSSKVHRRMDAVVREGSKRVIAAAQTSVGEGGNMPVDTGFLRNSLATELNGSTALKGENSYVLAIAQMKAGDVLQSGWTAEYAKHVEYGTKGRPGRLFMNSAAQQWQRIVSEVVKEVERMP